MVESLRSLASRNKSSAHSLHPKLSWEVMYARVCVFANILL